jgi:hypothetical protein
MADAKIICEDITDIIGDIFDVLKRHKAKRSAGICAMEVALLTSCMHSDITKQEMLEMVANHWDELARCPEHYDA